MKKERPILFSTEMVKAILDGRKTQTRRVVKIDTLAELKSHIEYVPGVFPRYRFKAGNMEWFVLCPYGKPGDLLWVRETFCPIKQDTGGFRYEYKADGYEPTMWLDEKWKPSIHIPKDAARIWLEITNVRVERLQDISNGDAMREGVESIDHGVHWRNYVKDEISCFIHPRHSFESLWKSINGSNWNRDWSLNPFVWVVEFKRIERP
jgi:hypothetical protein